MNIDEKWHDRPNDTLFISARKNDPSQRSYRVNKTALKSMGLNLKPFFFSPPNTKATSKIECYEAENNSAQREFCSLSTLYARCHIVAMWRMFNSENTGKVTVTQLPGIPSVPLHFTESEVGLFQVLRTIDCCILLLPVVTNILLHSNMTTSPSH